MKKITLISQTSLAISAGLLLTACSSMRHEEPAYSNTGYNSGDNYHSSDYSSSTDQSQTRSYDQQRTISESSGAQTVNELDIPLHEERVNIGKRTVDAGQVTIRKIVTTETVNQPVQLRRERLVIDRNSKEGQQFSQQGNSSSQSYSANRQSSSQSSSDWQPGAETVERSSTQSQETQVGSPRALEQSDRAAIASEPAGAANQSESQYQTSETSSSSTSRTGQSSQNLNSGNAANGAAFQEQTYTIRLQEEQPVIQKNVVQTGRVTAHKTSQTQQQNISEQVRREDVQLDKSGANVEVHGNFNSASGQISEPSGAQRHELNSSTNIQSSESQKTIRESSGSQNVDRGVNQNTDSTSGRVPSKGQGAQDLKQQPDQFQNP